MRQRFLTELDVQPDPFQTEALDALDAGRSVLVMAPTGSGKTLVADYAIARALEAGTTAVYTTPLKALSNQKHRDLCKRLGKQRVGLITGDRVVNPGAPVLVMTTEVLRAMLYDRAFAERGLGVVVLDEFHYLQDPDRGSAWEEVVIHAPAEASLVCLSATIPDAEVVRDWLRDVHGPTALIVADRRPVELHHVYAVGSLRSAPKLLPMHVDGQINQIAELFDGNRRATRTEDGLRQRDRGRAVPPQRPDLLQSLAESSLLPAIWFMFSRAGCDDAVASLVADGVRLTSEAEAYRVRELVRSALTELDAGELRAIDAESWQRGLEAGIAAHHGGLAPVQREVVEAAFGEGLLKVAFATETLALGVNLPARTVVFDRMVRPGGELVSAAEFAQLAGRAGRRGIDSAGQVIVPWSEQVSFRRIADLVGGRLASIRSEFRVTPAMAANLVRTTGHAGEAVSFVESSLRHRLDSLQVKTLRADLAERHAELALLPAAEVPLPAGDSGADQAEFRQRIEQSLTGLEPGDVLIDPSRTAAGPVVVLTVGRKRGKVYVEAVRPDARRVQLTVQSLRTPMVSCGRIDLPEWVRTERGHARRAADALAAFDLPPVADVAPPAAKPRLSRSSDGREQLTASIAKLESLIAAATGAVETELAAVIRLLRRRGHLSDWSLTRSGHVVRRLFHPSGLLLAECLTAGVLDPLEPAELASAASWFTVRTSLGGPRPTGFANQRLVEAYERVRDITRSVLSDEQSEGLPPTQHPEPALGVPVYRWANGDPLDVAIGSSGVLVGDLVRELRQVAELLDQVLTVPGSHRAAADAAIAAIRRGTVVSGDVA
ncbi:DEAD/DEAH box helicase [Flindersiella endophytica]